jgi:hypothetical protein
MMRLMIIILLIAALAAAASALNQMTLVGQYVGENQGDYFGTGTAMGDFDNDGYDEFIIGAWEWNDDAGKNYFYDWDGNWPTNYLWTVQGDSAEFHYDYSDQNLGDVSGDGIDDFGLHEWRTGQDYSRVDIFFGATDFDSIPDFSITLNPGNWIGMWMDSCGDVNGDGGDDLILMVWPEGSNYLTAQIYFGGEVLDTIPDWSYSPNLTYSRVCGLGDVNADGYNDVMLMGIEQPPLLFFGGSPMDTIPDLTFYDYSYNKNAAIGDVNADGYNDFSFDLVPGNDSTGQGVYFGGPDVDTIPDAYLVDELGEPTAAPDFVTHGDVNGDGIDDIITGDGIWGLSVCYVYLGGPWFNPVPDAMIYGLDPMYQWGEEMSVGDVNGDGRDEILISASAYWFYQGLAQLFTGPEEWIDYGAPVEPGELPQTPGWYKLDQNFPNPFNASTTIHFELGKPSVVNATIYDLKGDEIRTLIADKQMLPGGYNVSWNGRNQSNQPVSSGVYLLKFRVDQFTEIRKMVMVR